MNGTAAPPADSPPVEGQQALQPELQPQTPGTYYGELSPQGQWFWDGTGTPTDQWIANPKVGQQAEVTPQAAPTPGTAILPTATIDSLFTLVYGTRSADLAATPTYSWATGNQIIAQWPGLMTPQNVNNNSAIFCTFNARTTGPSSISQ